MRVLNTSSAGFSLRVGKKEGNAAVFNISSAGIYLDKVGQERNAGPNDNSLLSSAVDFNSNCGLRLDNFC